MERVKSFFSAVELNPIVVKELRQSVRSWAVVGTLLLFLIVLFFTVMGFALSSNVTLNMSNPVGREVLQVIATILIFASMVFIPVYVGVRINQERQPNNVDLLYITTLSPARIIRGKLFCGMYVALLFFSVCMPFMFFSNLLRGVDLPTIVMVLGISYLLVVAAIQFAIFIACLPVTKGFKLLLTIGLLVFAIPGIFGFVFTSFRMFRTGVGAALWSWSFWEPALTTISLALLVFGFMHVVSIAMITPPTANRAFPIRLYVFISWLLSSGVVGTIYWRTGDNDVVVGWLYVFILAAVAGFMISVSESDKPSIRIRRTIPRGKLKRWLAFFFYSGSAGGMMWTLIGCLFTFIAAQYMLILIPEYSAIARPSREMARVDVWGVIAAFLLYAFSYAMFGLAMHRWFFPHKNNMLAGVFGVSLPALWAIVPMVVYYFVRDFSVDYLKRRQLGNPFNLFGSNWELHWEAHFWCALAMAGIAILINLGWARRCFASFTAIEPSPAPEAKES